MFISALTLCSKGVSFVIPHYHEQEEKHFQDAEALMVAHPSLFRDNYRKRVV